MAPLEESRGRRRFQRATQALGGGVVGVVGCHGVSLRLSEAGFVQHVVADYFFLSEECRNNSQAEEPAALYARVNLIAPLERNHIPPKAGLRLVAAIITGHPISPHPASPCGRTLLPRNGECPRAIRRAYVLIFYPVCAFAVLVSIS